AHSRWRTCHRGRAVEEGIGSVEGDAVWLGLQGQESSNAWPVDRVDGSAGRGAPGRRAHAGVTSRRTAYPHRAPRIGDVSEGSHGASQRRSHEARSSASSRRSSHRSPTCKRSRSSGVPTITSGGVGRSSTLRAQFADLIHGNVNPTLYSHWPFSWSARCEGTRTSSRKSPLCWSIRVVWSGAAWIRRRSSPHGRRRG